MKINIEPRYLYGFEQSRDGNITIWKDESEDFGSLNEALCSILLTLDCGDTYNLEEIWDYNCTPLYDYHNDLVLYLYYQDIVDYKNGKEVTLYAFSPDEIEKDSINVWLNEGFN